MPFDIDPSYIETTTPTAKVLRDAAAYIEQHGWCSHKLHDGSGSVCVVGALNMVLYGKPISFGPNRPERPLACDAIHRFVGNKSAVDWNNTPGRTKAEVVAALNGAADALP